MKEAILHSIGEHQDVIASTTQHVALLTEFVDRLVGCFKAGGKLYLLGNGGSAADAQHIAAELVGRFKENRQALPAIAMTTDTSILTAVANDIGAEHVFERQVEALVTDSDVVWALSVSGTSPNVIHAMKRARTKGATTLGFTGSNGQTLSRLCDRCFLVDHASSDRVQEVHQLAYHIICEHVERAFCSHET